MYLTYNGKYLLVNGKYVNYGNPLDLVTQAYLGRLTTQPSDSHKSAINDFIIAAKTIIVDKADVMYLGNINDSNDSFVNVVKDSHHGTRQGTGLVWDPYWGYTNPDGSGYVDTNYNPSTQAFRYSLNDAGIGVCTTDNTGGGQHALYCYEDTTKRSGFLLNYVAVNDGANGAMTIPFLAGLQIGRRTASNARACINQNMVNSTSTQVSTSIPNSNFYLFRHIAAGSTSNYLGGLNLIYIGASLTDGECALLNETYNDYLIKCLFIKYGYENWGVQMAQSYFLDLHNFEKYEAWEVYEFIKRMQPDYIDGVNTGYYYNTFGPNGQNKTIADFIMLFKAGGNLLANTWTKTGNTLRWNQDAIITSSNNMPAYTRGNNLGIITLSSTDGWDSISIISINQSTTSINSFYGNFPRLDKLIIPGTLATIHMALNRHKVDARFNIYACNSIQFNTISYPGYYKFNLDLHLGKSMTGYLSLFGSSDQSQVTGNISLWTNEFQSFRSFRIQGNSSNRYDNLIGTLNNFIVHDLTTSIIINLTGITGGISVWNKNIATAQFSNNRFSTEAVDAQLAVINNYFTSISPIKNLILDLSGATMGIPTDGSSNSDLLGIMEKHTAAGFTATITVRTS